MTDEIIADTGAEDTGTDATEESIEVVSADQATDEQLEALIEQGRQQLDNEDQDEEEDSEEDLGSDDEEDIDDEDVDSDDESDDEEDEEVEDEFEEDDEEEIEEPKKEEKKSGLERVSQKEITQLNGLQTRVHQLDKALKEQRVKVAEARNGDGVTYADEKETLKQLEEASLQVRYDELVMRNKLNVKATVEPWKTQKEDIRAVLLTDGVEADKVDGFVKEIYAQAPEYVVQLHKRAKAERNAFDLATNNMQLIKALKIYKAKFGDIDLGEESTSAPTSRVSSKDKRDVKVKIKKTKSKIDTIKSSLKTVTPTTSKPKKKQYRSSKDIANLSDKDLNAYLASKGLT